MMELRIWNKGQRANDPALRYVCVCVCVHQILALAPVENSLHGGMYPRFLIDPAGTLLLFSMNMKRSRTLERESSKGYGPYLWAWGWSSSSLLVVRLQWRPHGGVGVGRRRRWWYSGGGGLPVATAHPLDRSRDGGGVKLWQWTSSPQPLALTSLFIALRDRGPPAVHWAERPRTGRR
jgi:hypothetical protein